MRPYSSVLVAVVVAAMAPSARAACEITDPTPTGALPTLMKGQSFRFVATDDCEGLTFHARGITLNPDTAGRVGLNRHRYAVGIPAWQWRDFESSPLPTFQWTVSARSDGMPMEVTFSNEMDADRDGWTRTEGDRGACDHAPTANPGQLEISDNGVDDDCDGVVDNRAVLSSEADLLIEGLPDDGASYGIGLAAAVGDFDADGQADVLLGAAYQAGSAFIVYGPASGVRSVVDETQLTDIAAHSLAQGVAVGDANSDGLDDALLGAPGDPTHGAYLFLGPITASRDVADADAQIVGPDSYAPGRQPLLAPDFDGDGQAEIVLDAWYDQHHRNRGSVSVVPADASGTVDVATGASYTYLAYHRKDYLGVDTAGIGDRNGDGIDDLALSSWGAVFLVDGGGAPGTYDVLDAASVVVGRPIVPGTAFFGARIATADYDGDGELDLFAGAGLKGTHDSGAVRCFLGPFPHDIPNVTDADTTWIGESQTTRTTTYHLASDIAVGDVDGDGGADVIMSDLYGGPSNNGRAYLQRGYVTGRVPVVELLTFEPTPTYSRLGWSVAAVPDWTGDGADEILLGAPYTTNESGEHAGAAYVFFSDSLFP